VLLASLAALPGIGILGVEKWRRILPTLHPGFKVGTFHGTRERNAFVRQPQEFSFHHCSGSRVSHRRAKQSTAAPVEDWRTPGAAAQPVTEGGDVKGLGRLATRGGQGWIEKRGVGGRGSRAPVTAPPPLLPL